MDNLKVLVQQILEERPLTRENDKVLYYYVLYHFGINTEIPLSIYLLDTEGVYPSYDTVSRTRRLVQQKNPDLLGTRAAVRFRKEKQEEIKEWVKENVNANA